MKLLVGVAVPSALLLLLLVGACSKSTCEKYADMEVKCGDIPSKEADMTRTLAEGMCKAADDEKGAFAEMFKAEAACAAKYTDCAQYKACTESAKSNLKL